MSHVGFKQISQQRCLYSQDRKKKKVGGGEEQVVQLDKQTGQKGHSNHVTGSQLDKWHREHLSSILGFSKSIFGRVSCSPNCFQVWCIDVTTMKFLILLPPLVKCWDPSYTTRPGRIFFPSILNVYFAWMYICVTHVCLMPTETRRRHQIL